MMYIILSTGRLSLKLKTCILQPFSASVGLRIMSSKITPPASANNMSAHIIAKPRESSTLQNEATSSATTKLLHASPLVVLQPLTVNCTNLLQDKDWKEIITNYSKLPQHYLMLSKIRLTSLVVMTSMAGYALAPAPFDLSTFLLVSAGTGLISCAANSVNQFFEMPFDSQMSRTRNRVLVRGVLTPLHAVSFAAVCGVAGITTLYCGVNGLTAVLGSLNLVLYTLIYTPMKRISILNTWVGSVVGAIPPLMGWAGCMGTLGPGAWIMAGMLYAWQFPHFNALSWNLRPDYSKAGYRMMAVTDPDLCRRTALRYTVALSALSFAAPLLDVTNWLFALEAIPLNAYFAYLAWQFYRRSDSASSRKMFRFSLLHLPLLMILLLINKKHWSTSPNSIGNTVSHSTDMFVVLPTEPEGKTPTRANISLPSVTPVAVISNC